VAEQPRRQLSNTIAIQEMGLPIIKGECPDCHRGDRSLIIVDFVPNRKNNTESTLYIRCIACASLYQSKVKQIVQD
jgi:hypothetical protein